jgi:hypothetical protein
LLLSDSARRTSNSGSNRRVVGCVDDSQPGAQLAGGAAPALGVPAARVHGVACGDDLAGGLEAEPLVRPGDQSGWPARTRCHRHRADRGKPLTWIEIGSAAGPTAPVPSAALRAARLQIVGSGQGSVSTREILAELPALAQEITSGTFDIGARFAPLADVEQARADAAHSARRIVLAPQPRTPPG